jgi:hypothetical protein
VWAILGQASGAYVGPTCWAVLFMMGAAAVLYECPAIEPAYRRRPRMADLRHRLARIGPPPGNPPERREPT